MIQEGSIHLPLEKPRVVSRALPVFYNPVMALNRTITLLVLLAWEKKHLRLGLPLAGTGIRAMRMLKELPHDKIKEIVLNDLDPKAVDFFMETAKANAVPKKYKIKNTEANVFLLQEKPFDYIDLDPFGSPNPFLDSAIKRIKKEGILAVTATDTAPLAGTYPKACLRKYWARPLRNDFLHEIGLRILIRKVQLIGAQYEKALFPLLSYSKDHYYRIYFLCEQGKQNVDTIIKQHGILWFCPVCKEWILKEKQTKKHEHSLQQAGPLWLGNLFSASFMQQFEKTLQSLSIPWSKAEEKWLRSLLKEAAYEASSLAPEHRIGFYDIHKLAKTYKFSLPQKKELEDALAQQQIPFAWSHTNPNGLKTTISVNELNKLIISIEKSKH